MNILINPTPVHNIKWQGNSISGKLSYVNLKICNNKV